MGDMAQFSVRLPDALIAEVDAVATENQVSRSEVIRRMLTYALAAKGTTITEVITTRVNA